MHNPLKRKYEIALPHLNALRAVECMSNIPVRVHTQGTCTDTHTEAHKHTVVAASGN